MPKGKGDNREKKDSRPFLAPGWEAQVGDQETANQLSGWVSQLENLLAEKGGERKVGKKRLPKDVIESEAKSRLQMFSEEIDRLLMSNDQLRTKLKLYIEEVKTHLGIE